MQAVRYPPHGLRGVAGITRASRYGAIPNYNARADAEVCLLVQVETAATLPHIEAICAVDGVDGVFIGPADLAASMGHPGNPGHPDVKAAVLDAVRRIRKAGKPAGVLLPLDPEFLSAGNGGGHDFHRGRCRSGDLAARRARSGREVEGLSCRPDAPPSAPHWGR